MKRLVLILIVLITCVVVFIGCGGGGGTTNNYYSSGGALPNPSPDPGKTDVNITVQNSSNNQPIDKATITFTPTSIKIETNTTGNATAKNMAVQQYKIKTEHSLYNTDEQNISPTAPSFAYTVKLVKK